MLTDKQKIKVLEERIKYLEKDLDGYRKEKENYILGSFTETLSSSLQKEIDRYMKWSQDHLRFYVDMEVNAVRNVSMESYELMKQLSKKMELLEGLSHGSDRPERNDIRENKD